MIKKKRILTVSMFVFLGLLSSVGYSQKYYDETQSFNETRYIPSSYIGAGMGLNEIGFLGVAGEIPVADHLSVNSTLGLGGWGFKFRLGMNYYPNELSGKSSFGILYSRAGGLEEFELVPENSNRTYLLNLMPAHNIDFVYNRNLFVGRKSKFVLTAGYTLSLNAMAYEEINGQNIDATTRQVLALLQPGGILIGIKFLYGN